MKNLIAQLTRRPTPFNIPPLRQPRGLIFVQVPALHQPRNPILLHIPVLHLLLIKILFEKTSLDLLHRSTFFKVPAFHPLR